MSTARSRVRARRAALEFTPKLVTALSEGYGLRQARSDAIAGLTVSVVALPLAMALAIASGTTPDKGLVTAVVAGFLISALGGSRFQIGGPTGAFVVVVFDVVARHGYEGLVLATFLAGLMLVVAGFARLGAAVKYIPEPVITGFTAGIGVIIASSQIRDFLGLDAAAPAEFVAKFGALWSARDTFDPATAALAVGSLVAILALRRLAPRAPGFLLVVLAGAVAVWALKIPVDTIGSRFGGVPSGLPAPALPAFSFELLRDVAPSAFTIAFLAGLESLLSAVVADGMTGRKHRSNGELIAQGVANSASALFGGMPATGAIARTATNIRAGAATPVAGMLHAVFLLVFMLVAAPLAAFVPLAALAAVLLVVAWNMAEPHKFRDSLRAPVEDRLLLVVTFALTVLVDLTFAIEVGVVMAALVFMHRMAQAAEMKSGVAAPSGDEEDDDLPESPEQRLGLPPGVEVFQFRGPLFFGAAGRLADAFDRVGLRPRAVILRMRDVPFLDATAAGVLTRFLRRMRADDARVILSGLQPQPKSVLADLGVFDGQDAPALARDFAQAKTMAAKDAARLDELSRRTPQ